MNRRKFFANLGTLGLFTILPGAGRVWKARKNIKYMEFMCDKLVVGELPYGQHVLPIIFRRPIDPGHFKFIPSFTDYIEQGVIKPK